MRTNISSHLHLLLSITDSIPVPFHPCGLFVFPVINKGVHKWLIKGFTIGAERVEVSHLQCAKDTLILIFDWRVGIRNLELVINYFKLVSGFSVNWEKRCLMGLSNRQLERKWFGFIIVVWMQSYRFSSWIFGFSFGREPEIVFILEPVIMKCYEAFGDVES